MFNEADTDREHGAYLQHAIQALRFTFRLEGLDDVSGCGTFLRMDTEFVPAPRSSLTLLTSVASWLVISLFVYAFGVERAGIYLGPFFAAYLTYRAVRERRTLRRILAGGLLLAIVALSSETWLLIKSQDGFGPKPHLIFTRHGAAPSLSR